ncbi:carboxylesterase family protein [Bibersteinia trehalosi]|uniref:carboxylesterase family protein n=1 Tax=Bibersteinia trehalosi TaxID=47735 RepID=UPI0020116A82|nr:carboxylesterase family protein [Bibersteinia trehalosi]
MFFASGYIFGESGGGAKVLTLMATPAAQGLFHKAIVQSGAVEKMGMTLTSREASRKVAEFTFENLGITDVAKLADFTPDQINAATDKALKQTAEALQLEGLQGGINLQWAPTLDGSYIPEQPVGEKYPEMAKNIPLLVGSNLTEWMSFPLQLDVAKYQNDNRNTWTDEQKQQKLTERFGDKTADIVAAFKQAYPDRNIADALYVDTFLRTPALKTARLKADQQTAPVYNYVFSWDTPVFNGIPMSYHTAEIAFVFNNIDKTQQATGGGEQAKKLAETMSTAWANFAKTGNPNGGDLPQWDAYNREGGATMIFDNHIKQVHHHDEALLKLLAPNAKF